MKKRAYKRKHVVLKTKRHKKFHHKVISFFRGDGGIYVIFILATAMAGAFALTGGILPQLNPTPPASSQVDIDTESAKQSSENALQLVDIKPKPTEVPTPTSEITPSTSPSISPSISQPPPVQECYNKTLVTLILDYSNSMLTPNSSPKYTALNSALGSFYTQLSGYANAGIGAQAFTGKDSGNTPLDGVFNLLNYKLVKNVSSSDKQKITQVDKAVLENSNGGGTYMRNGFSYTISKLESAPSSFAGYRKVAIIFSDGIPEETWEDRESHNGDANSSSVCLGSGRYQQRCFSIYQDPRVNSTNRLPDLVKGLKDITDSVYVVGIYDSKSGEGLVFKDNLISLLQTIAERSTTPFYQFIDLKDDPAAALQKLNPAFQNIFKDVCK
ncbi:MAG: VWA domain-containing protein [Candidatus Levybacteria bacterium]|nr:VWA domain-containing protein [Candidatus Levybacteria bacterium]